MTSPIVSVAIPAFAQTAAIKESIASILEQTYAAMEVVVCVGFPTKETRSLIAELDDPHIFFIQNQENLGLARNLNKCISRTHGKYICILNPGDIMTPENIAQKIALLDSHPQVGLAYSNYSQKNETDCPAISEKFKIEKKFDFLKKQMLQQNHVLTSSAMIKRTVFEKVGLFNPQLKQSCEAEMWARIAIFFETIFLEDNLIVNRGHVRTNNSNDPMDFLSMQEEFLWKMKILEQHHNDIADIDKLKNKLIERYYKNAESANIKEISNGNDEEARRFQLFANLLKDAEHVSQKQEITISQD